MARRHQQGWLKKEKRSQGETWVLFFRTVRKSASKRVENKIPIGLVRDFPDRSCAWAEVGIICERLAQNRHCNINTSVVVHECVVRPKDLPNLLAGNNLALSIDKNSQNSEGLLAEQDPCRPRFHRLGSD